MTRGAARWGPQRAAAFADGGGPPVPAPWRRTPPWVDGPATSRVTSAIARRPGQRAIRGDMHGLGSRLVARPVYDPSSSSRNTTRAQPAVPHHTMHASFPMMPTPATRRRDPAATRARAAFRGAPLRHAAALLLALSAFALGGCAMVEVRSQDAGAYIAAKRGDMLTTGRPSALTSETIRVAGLEESACGTPTLDCIHALAAIRGIADERRLAALSELWLQQAIVASRATPDEPQIGLWLEAARHAYAYLFFSERSPGERAFEDRQTQVRDYYNYAAQQAAIELFELASSQPAQAGASLPGLMQYAGWDIEVALGSVRLPEGVALPKALVPATTLSFDGLRSTYRRDGFGAELVAIMADDAVAAVPSAAPVPGPDDTEARRPSRPRPPRRVRPADGRSAAGGGRGRP